MTISMYQATVPASIRILNNLAAIMDKAATHAEARKIEPAVLLNSRLFPDMLPLVRQIQIATDGIKGGAARLAAMEPPKYEDNEATIPECVARIRKTITFLESLTAAQIDGSEERTIHHPMRSGTREFKGMQYLLTHILPNFYFHVTTAYAILRHNGVELGKQDFLGKA